MDKADVGDKAESVMEEVHSADERPGSGSQSAARPHRPPRATAAKREGASEDRGSEERRERGASGPLRPLVKRVTPRESRSQRRCCRR